MNLLIKYILLNIVTLCFVINITTQCMFIKNIRNISFNIKQYSLKGTKTHGKKHGTTTHAQPLCLQDPHTNLEIYKSVVNGIVQELMLEENLDKALTIYNNYISPTDMEFDDSIALELASTAFTYSLTEDVQGGKRIVNTDHTRNEALLLFEKLIVKGQGIEEATQIALSTITSNYNTNTQYNALSLFRFLIARNYALKQATQAAIIGLTDSDPLIIKESRALLRDIKFRLNEYNNETRD